MSYSIYIAYAITFLIPAAIIGFSAFAKELRAGFMLAWISFMSLMSYYIYKGLIPAWILILVIIIIAAIFGVMFNNLLGGGDE